MAKFCSQCGKEIDINEQFCSTCGTPTIPKDMAVCDQDNVVGKGPFFWLLLLFSVPFFGFIASVVFSFAPQNKSLKNFSRAVLIWNIIGIVLVVIFACLFIPAIFKTTGIAF